MKLCGSCAKGRAKHSHGCPISEPSLLAVRDCRVSSRRMNENSPTVLVLLRRTHGAERDCQVVREATKTHAVDCVRVCLDAWGLSEVWSKGNSESAAQVLVDEMQVRGRGYCAEDREHNTNLRSCAARRARSHSCQQLYCIVTAQPTFGAQSAREA